ncbi:MAG: hypothetical protein SRB2_04800 [Desulfobacteraceae bacterium Eth-SRB2]|nr:MAG: hypothetical protein SRB2_04800 [Desulfobacteraceae bacterium Eth-SRB2]
MAKAVSPKQSHKRYVQMTLYWSLLFSSKTTPAHEGAEDGFQQYVNPRLICEGHNYPFLIFIVFRSLEWFVFEKTPKPEQVPQQTIKLCTKTTATSLLAISILEMNMHFKSPQYPNYAVDLLKSAPQNAFISETRKNAVILYKPPSGFFNKFFVPQPG